MLNSVQFRPNIWSKPADKISFHGSRKIPDTSGVFPRTNHPESIDKTEDLVRLAEKRVAFYNFLRTVFGKPDATEIELDKIVSKILADALARDTKNREKK